MWAARLDATRQWLDSALIYCNTLAMEVEFTPEQDAALLLIEVVRAPAFFRAGVRKGIEQADQRLFIEEAEMDTRISRMLSK